MENIYNLVVNKHKINILNDIYDIVGFIEFDQNKYLWKEYKLLMNGETFWLSVEKNHSNKRYMLSTELSKKFSVKESFTLYKQVSYTLESIGQAKVVQVSGDVDVQIKEQMLFKEYVSVDNSNQILSYEEWDSGEKEYSQSVIIYEEEIKGDGYTISFLSDNIQMKSKEYATTKDLMAMPIGQYLYIGSDSYFVVSYVENKSQGFTWKEYEILNEKSKKRYWLSVDKNEIELSRSILYSSITFSQNTTNSQNPAKAYYKNTEFTLKENGTGSVVSFTSGNYDPFEKFKYKEYYIPKTNKTLCVEIWSDEREASVGEILEKDSIYIQDKLKPGASFHNSESKGCFQMLAILLAIAFISILCFVLPNAKWIQPTIASQLRNNTSYTEVTSITINEKQRLVGTVYESQDESSMGSIATDIISMDPSNVVSALNIPNEENGEILITTEREQVLVYMSDKNTIYVQVSKLDKYPELSVSPYGALYLSRARNFYRNGYNGYRFFSDSNGQEYQISEDEYSGHINSARQSSITARGSSGGGTGFGK